MVIALKLTKDIDVILRSVIWDLNPIILKKFPRKVYTIMDSGYATGRKKPNKLCYKKRLRIEKGRYLYLLVNELFQGDPDRLGARGIDS